MKPKIVKTNPQEGSSIDVKEVMKKRGITAKAEVLKKTGPLLTSGEIATRIGLVSGQSVRNLKSRGRLLAISVDLSGESYFPEFQLEGSSVQEWIPKLLKRIPEGWSALAFLCANRKNLNGSSYLIDITRDPLKAGEMLAAADSYVE